MGNKYQSLYYINYNFVTNKFLTNINNNYIFI